MSGNISPMLYPYWLTIEQYVEIIHFRESGSSSSSSVLLSSFDCHHAWISDAQGEHLLTVPLRHNRGHSQNPGEAEIHYGIRWEQQHWNALKTAYGKTAYFEFYKEEIRSVLFSKKKYLMELNALCFCLLQKSLALPDVSFQFTHKKKKDTSPGKYSNIFGIHLPDAGKLCILEWLFRYGPVGTWSRGKEYFSAFRSAHP